MSTKDQPKIPLHVSASPWATYHSLNAGEGPSVPGRQRMNRFSQANHCMRLYAMQGSSNMPLGVNSASSIHTLVATYRVQTIPRMFDVIMFLSLAIPHTVWINLVQLLPHFYWLVVLNSFLVWAITTNQAPFPAQQGVGGTSQFGPQHDHCVLLHGQNGSKSAM